MSDQTDIIIKGGSVELTFDETHFPKESNDPKMRKARDWKITQVIITGGGMEWASEVFPQGSECTIKVICKQN